MNSIKLETKVLIFNYLLCISSYRLVKDAYQAIANLLFYGAISNRILLLVVMVYFAYFLMFLCGMAMGFLTKKRVVLHSLMAATASVALDIYSITNIVNGDYIWVLSMLASGALLGGLGGAIALALKKLTPSYKHN